MVLLLSQQHGAEQDGCVRQAVGVGHQPQSPRLFGEGWAVVGGDGPQPAGVGDVAQPVARGRVIEVDERGGAAVDEDVVAGRRVVVADNRLSAGEL